MNLELGIKSDPVEYRFSYGWLFSLMKRKGVRNLQLGSFFEMYSLPDAYFVELKEEAASYGVTIRSLFTAHRELGGFFTGNSHLEKAARKNYERLIESASILGAEYAGSNPGAVYRDRMHEKTAGLRRYMEHMKELMVCARTLGLKGLTIEPMSCSAEPPTTPEEIDFVMSGLQDAYLSNPETCSPVYLCGDISHGYADRSGIVKHRHDELFLASIPWMCEFHIKNTDSSYGSTFGFSEEDRKRGIVDLPSFSEMIIQNKERWPVKNVVGYLEINGPKLGRDYSDYLLEEQLESSIDYLHTVFSAVKEGVAT